MRFQQHCLNCEDRWNTGEGDLDEDYMFILPIACPRCNSKEIELLAEGWETGNVVGLKRKDG